jgi:hypothetical protein
VYSKNSPKKSPLGSHSDRAISYNTQLEPAPTSTVPAGAVSKQLWHSTHYDTIASTLAGFPIAADGEDDYTEWGSLLYGDDPYAVLGFTMIWVRGTRPTDRIRGGGCARFGMPGITRVCDLGRLRPVRWTRRR